MFSFNYSFIRREDLELIRKIRASIVKTLKPRASYFLSPMPQRNLKPISDVYGFDRGKPIDRFYIETFLRENSKDIKGVCLEITDNDYTIRFGGGKVSRADALDIDTANRNANIYGDLKKIPEIKDNTYDCFIVTQTFVMIDDFDSAVRECYRILKPGGALLVTMPCLGRVGKLLNQYWRFTAASGWYVFGKYFGKDNLTIKTYGNVLAGQCFWVGVSSDELTSKELDYNDPEYPIIVAVRAVK